jgi:tetratricopeptide (TPR) repeat protein
MTDPNAQPQSRRPFSLFIAGTVMMHDGSMLPTGVVIERSCGGQAVKESYVGQDGSFSFQVGASSLVIADASDRGDTRIGDTIGPASVLFPSTAGRNQTRLVGCELRAQLGGYRSSTLDLNLNQTMGTYDAGTLVLYPAVRIKGTTVSVTTLAAPKKAKKALEMADKALQKKDLENAEMHLRTALDGYPSYAAAWYKLGQVRELSLHMEAARDAFEKALEVDANYVAPYIALSRIAAVNHRWQESANLSASALKLNPLEFPFAYYLDSLANYNLNRLDIAERSARALERMDSQHKYPETHILLANIYRRKHDTAAEAEQLRAYLKLAPQAADVSQIRARLQMIAGM